MVAMGYLYKQIVPPPAWLNASQVREVCSVSGCMSPVFADYVGFWRHNGYWLFDAPAIMQDIAREAEVSLTGMRLFYYEAFADEFDAPGKRWASFVPNEGGPVPDVRIPENRRLLGFDVVTFFARSTPECSPLSCNGLAEHIPTNEYCLFPTFTAARDALESGAFDNSEDGPFRILAVYEV